MYNIFIEKGSLMALIFGILILIIAEILIFKFFPTTNSKLISMLLCLTLFCTIYICVQKPKLHKMFSINTVEYLIKINDNGSLTTTKKTTTTTLRETAK